MKRSKLTRLFLGSCMVATALSFTACGTNNAADPKDESSNTSETATKENESKDAAKETGDTGAKENSVSEAQTSSGDEAKSENSSTVADGETFSTKLFSLTLPKDVEGLYTVDVNDHSIMIYETKASKEGGWGGFAYGFTAEEKPSDYAGSPGTCKLGEITTADGKIYDMVYVSPTDVQSDPEKEEYKDYVAVANTLETSEASLTGIEGAKYVAGAGTKGEDLYTDILEKYYTAITEKWDPEKLEAENMSYMYASIPDALDNTGYFFYDVNCDGVEDLFIGENGEEAFQGVVYDIYTMVDRVPAHVISGGSRDRYYISNELFICNEASGGAAETDWIVYILTENTTKLFSQLAFKYDENTNKKQPWFRTYDYESGEWENITEEEFNDSKETFCDYKKIEYTPFSTLKK